jgi:hypothetical protein
MKMSNRTLARAVSAAIVLGAVTTGTIGFASAASAAESAKGGSICGIVWHDVNEDGIRQADEPVLPNVTIGDLNQGTRYVNSGPDGRYCLTGLPVGDYVLQANDLSGFGKSWTHDGRDSKFGFTTGLGYDHDDASNPIPIKIRKSHGKFTRVENFDAGYLTATSDLQAVQLLVAPNLPVGTPIHVGDVIDVYGAVAPSGNAAEQLGATLTLPEGMTILDRQGGMPSYVQGQQVIGDFHERRFPGAVEFVGAKVRIDQPITAGQVKVETHLGVFHDSNPNNNVLTQAFSTAG